MILCKHARLGERLSNFSHAIQSYTESIGLSMREYVGIRIGKDLHEDLLK